MKAKRHQWRTGLGFAVWGRVRRDSTAAGQSPRARRCHELPKVLQVSGLGARATSASAAPPLHPFRRDEPICQPGSILLEACVLLIYGDSKVTHGYSII